MNDGYWHLDPESGVFANAGADTGVDASRGAAPAPSPTHSLRLHQVATAIPQLGTVLWLHRVCRERAFPRARLLPEGLLLLEHPALAALADCASVHALCAVTTQGPREWLEFRDVHNAAIAKLYLLPETDYLAWDAMLGRCGAPAAAVAQRGWQAHAAFMRSVFVRLGAAWQARIVRLPLLRLSCLSVLGLRAPPRLSALGRRLACAIAEDEHAAWGRDMIHAPCDDAHTRRLAGHRGAPHVPRVWTQRSRPECRAYGVERSKVIGTRAQALRGAPSNVPGRKIQCSTASRAARSRRGEPLDVCISIVCALPSAPTSTRRITVPCSRRRRASAGYGTRVKVA
ncbi:MAG: hypothetical protein P4L92_05895 [Rudaea sp.]|nr:hypothetical protein [Rudaea sp.]